MAEEGRDGCGAVGTGGFAVGDMKRVVVAVGLFECVLQNVVHCVHT